MSPNLISFTDLNGKIVYVNKKYEQIEGPNIENYQGKYFTDIFPTQHRSIYWERDLAAIKSGGHTTRETRYQHKDGAIHTYLATQFPLLDNDNRIIALGSSAVDITIYKDSQKKLEKISTDLSLAQNVAGIGSWQWNLQNQKVYWSNETYDLLGLAPKNSDISMEFFLNLVHPDDRSIVQYKLNAVLEKFELDNFEYRILNQDGSYRHLRKFPRLEYDQTGKPLRLFGLVHDITQQKLDAAEKLNLEKRIQQYQKTESIGRLTRGITHEFNNILTCILGYTGLSQHAIKHGKLEKLENYINEIDIAGKNARDLVKQLLIFSHSSTGKPELLSLQQTVLDSIKMLDITLPSNINIKVSLKEALPKILMDATQLSQVIVNLCVNAIDALMSTGGQMDIALNYSNKNENTCSSCQKFFHGAYLKLSIQDNGVGIQAGVLSKIFDPFFSTKEHGRGIGMGLSVVHGIIHRYEGHIVVESEYKFGSTFHVFFPIIEAE